MSGTIPWTVSEIVDAVGGRFLSGNRHKVFTGVSIDSRTVSPENFFVAIQGERHDGHDFIDEVLQKGVSGILVSRSKCRQLSFDSFKDTDPVFIAAEDTTKALGALASFNCTRTGVRVVAITGSNGKTSTRKMVSAVVARKYSTLSSQGNLNNHIGVPLTLLNLSSEHKYAVVEMGANHPGEIAYLARMCHPDIAVLTNIGPAHLEGFGSLEGVALAKGELLEHMSPDGLAVLNAEDERIVSMAGRAPGKVMFYGISEKANIRALNVMEEKGKTSFTLQIPGQRDDICIPVSGFFMVLNALAAAGVGYHLGLDASEIKKALENDYHPAPSRMNLLELENGIHVIDDTYNANPESMTAALKVLKHLKGGHRAVFVAGDMLELGTHAPDFHKKIGETAAGTQISRIYITGNYADSVAEGAEDRGMAQADIFKGTREEILADLKTWLRAGDWVLVKGSRGMKMERIVEGLKKQAGKS